MSVEVSQPTEFALSEDGQHLDLLSGEFVSESVKTALLTWLPVLQGLTVDPEVQALQIVDGRWYRMRLWSDLQSGPRLSAVQVRDEPDLSNVLGLLNHRDLAEGTDPAVPTAVHSVPVASSVLALILGHPIAFVRSLSEARVIAGKLAVGHPVLRWICSLGVECPAGVEFPAGPGLVVSPDIEPPPQEMKQFVQSFGAEELLALPLANLCAICSNYRDRKLLLLAALSGSPDLDLGELLASRDVMRWIAGTRARGLLLDSLPPQHIGFWLSSDLAAAGDLDALRSRLTSEHRDAVLRLVQTTDRPFYYYDKAFPNDVEGATELLPAEIRATWNALRSRTHESLGAGELDQLFEHLRGSSLEDQLALQDYAHASRSMSTATREQFCRQLTAHGLPAPVASALVFDGELEQLPALVSDLRPCDSWLQGISEHAIWKNARAFLDAPAWRSWWLDCVAQMISTGQISRENTVQRGIQEREAKLLELGGASRTLTRLVSGEPIELPPTEWQPDGDRLLRSMVEDDVLFDRLSAPLTSEGLRWLQSLCGDLPQAGLLDELITALREGTPIQPRLVRRVAHLLGRDQLLRQVAAWAGQQLGPARDGVIELLLQQDSMSPREREWLRARTISLGILPMRPNWSSADMRSLLPLLDPINDVLRVVLEQPEREADDEGLLIDLREVIAEQRLLPPARASQRARELRHEWVEALSHLPGWEDFGTWTSEDAMTRVRNQAQKVLHDYGNELAPDALHHLRNLSYRE